MMDKIKAYFDGFVPEHSPEQIAGAVIQAAKESKRRRIRPIVAAAAAAVVMTAGVSAAAATGLLNINEIFGGRITAEDETLAGALVGAAKDFTWTVSDEDYAIGLKGVTGSESDMLLMYEIVRTDGKPVTDFMTNIPEDGILKGFIDISFSDENAFSAACDTNVYCVNEQGNIEVFNRIITNGDLTGQHYSVRGTNLYPEQQMWDYLQHKDIGITMYTPLEGSERPVGFYKKTEPAGIELNDENIIGLELSWSIDFTYSPSEAARLSKAIKEDAEISVSRWLARTGGLDTLECKVTKSHFSCVGGWIEAEYRGEATIGIYDDKHNDIYLLTDSGEQLPCTFVGWGSRTSYIGEPVTSIDIEVRYGEYSDGPITAIDISEITAISINGETFPLA